MTLCFPMGLNQSYQTLTVTWNYLELLITLCMTRFRFTRNSKESSIAFLEYKGYRAGTRKTRSWTSRKLNLAEMLRGDTLDSWAPRVAWKNIKRKKYFSKYIWNINPWNINHLVCYCKNFMHTVYFKSFKAIKNCHSKALFIHIYRGGKQCKIKLKSGLFQHSIIYEKCCRTGWKVQSLSLCTQIAWPHQWPLTVAGKVRNSSG